MNEATKLLDVNVPMYAAGQEHPLKAACVWVMSQIAEGQLDVAIDTEMVQEVLYRYGALRRWDIAETMAVNLLELVPTVYPILEADIRTAVTLFSEFARQGVTARDLLHAAVMQNNSLTQVISTDSHFDLLPGITRLDPRDLYNQT